MQKPNPSGNPRRKGRGKKRAGWRRQGGGLAPDFLEASLGWRPRKGLGGVQQVLRGDLTGTIHSPRSSPDPAGRGRAPEAIVLVCGTHTGWVVNTALPPTPSLSFRPNTICPGARMGVQDLECGLRAVHNKTSTGFAARDITVGFGKTWNGAAVCGCSAREQQGHLEQ